MKTETMDIKGPKERVAEITAMAISAIEEMISRMENVMVE